MESPDDIFLNAREMGDPTERAAYLDQACGADGALRGRVEDMLRDADGANDFFGADDNLPGLVAPPLTEGPGTVIGRYKLLQKIGEGGMGVVYMAEQREPVVRKVALKIIKLGMDTRQVLGRFEAERQALALMDHPNIAKILDGGATDTGRPYFVMDLVQGLPITRFCDEANLPTRDRLDLFLEVCSAIQHAHQKGIIHRDIKPANILVTLHGDKPVPKVIDFGIAKAMQGRLTEKTLFTQFQHFIGTPAYMSPEQASLSGLDVDTRSDIYGLGVLLYELMTGKTPFDGKELMKVGFDEMRRTIREREPLRPSTRLTQELVAADVRRLKSNSGLGIRNSESDGASSRRLLQTKELIRMLRGDLDWIVMKCLEKERARRYETANGIAADLKRHLNSEPVNARPPSAVYRLQKTLRRNKVFFAAAGAVALTLIAGLSFSTWSLLRERKAHASEAAQRLRAEEAVTSLELQRAEDLLEKDEIVMGVAYLSRMVRQQPTNYIAVQRLLSTLTQRNFALPVGSPLRHAKKVIYAEFSPDGRRVATASLDFTARIWDARTGGPLTSPMVHPEAVRGAYFSPDGQRLLTFADDSQARLWEVATGRALGQPIAHTNHWIGTAEFSPDGRLVVTASDDTTVRLWDGLTGQPLSVPIKHPGVVRLTHFSPDGRRIVTACEDGTAQVWDAVTTQPVAKPFHLGAAVTSAEFSPEGKRVVTSALDLTTCVWDITSAEPLKPLVHRSQIDRANFSPDGERIIVSLHDGLTRIFNARDWAPLTQPMQHRDWTTSVEFGPEAQRVLTGSLDNTARLWDAENGEPLSAPMQHQGMVWSARLSPDGLFAVTASADGTARLWDVSLGAARSAPMNHGGPSWVSELKPLQAAEFSPDGEWVVTAVHDNTARVWSARTGRPRGLALQHAGWISAVQFSPDGDRVATASSDGTARIWDFRSGKPVSESLHHGDWVSGLRFSPDGQWLATAGGKDGTVRLWNARTGEPHGEPLPHRSTVTFICFSPDGQRLLSADSRDDRAQLRDVATGRLLAETLAREGAVLHGEFSPDGQRVATASVDGLARIWNAQTLQPLIEPMRGRDSWRQVRFSRDGRWVVTASDDGIAQVWNSQTGQPVGELMRHRAWVNQVEFSPNGALIVTASRDGTARLWDARTGRPVAEPFEHRGEVQSAHFSPDGRRVLTASQAGSAHLWDVPPPNPVLPTRGVLRKEALIEKSEIRIPKPDVSLLTSAATDREDERPGILLADLAEAVIGKRVNAQGALENVSLAGLGEVRQRVNALPRGADFTRWLAWFLADRSTRTISPNSPITVPEYIAQRMEEKTLVGAREAILLAPTNALAQAHLAEMLLVSPGSNTPVVVAEAEFLIRRAETLAPSDASVQACRRRIEPQIGLRSTR